MNTNGVKIDEPTPLFTALLANACSARAVLLLDCTGGPVDATFVLYHAARHALRRGVPVAFLALTRPATHHRAALRKFLGAHEGHVGVLCGWEAAGALAWSGGGAGALAAALLSAAGAAAGGGAPGFLLCVEDALGVCELAGGIGEGLAVLRALCGSAQLGSLCVRLPARCDWRVPPEGGGPLLAPSLSSRLEALAGAVLTARDLASGWSAEAHGTLEGAAGGGERGGCDAPPAPALLYKVAPDGSVREVGQRSRVQP
jgi:hypothetical protein